MAVESDADRLAMLADFGESWVKPGGATLTGIFEDAQSEALDAETYHGQIKARTSDLVDLEDRDFVTRASTGLPYVVAKIDPEDDSVFSIVHVMRA